MAPNASTYQAMASRASATVRYGSAAGRGTVRFGRGRRVVQFGDGGIGATHVDSFGSIRVGSKMQPIPARAQPRGELGIGLHRKVAAVQHGQRVVAVVLVMTLPPSGSGYSVLNARRARTSSASVACTVRPINSAHSGTEQSSM